MGHDAKVGEPALTCVFGYPWIGHPKAGHYHCIGCANWGLRLERAFQDGVQQGRWDEESYTPNERKAQQKRLRGIV